MDITAYQRRCFLAVAEELHFDQAAAQMGLRPSAVCEQIATLERQLAKPLFHRSSCTTKLTENGRQLIPLARNASAALNDVLAWANNAATTDLHIGLTVSHPIPERVLAAAAEQLSEVTWHMRHLGSAECYEALLQGEVDCVFVTEIGAQPGRRGPPSVAGDLRSYPV